MLFNKINIWFSTPRNICAREIELECIWTIVLEIINYSKEWGNTVDVIAIGICDNDMQYPELHKKHSNMGEDIIMHKLPKNGAAKAI